MWFCSTKHCTQRRLQLSCPQKAHEDRVTLVIRMPRWRQHQSVAVWGGGRGGEGRGRSRSSHSLTTTDSREASSGSITATSDTQSWKMVAVQTSPSLSPSAEWICCLDKRWVKPSAVPQRGFIQPRQRDRSGPAIAACVVCQHARIARCLQPLR